MQWPQTYKQLIADAQRQALYVQLIRQLNKDFLYANIDAAWPEDIAPEVLKNSLHETVYKLINEQFADYLNLLYIIDVSEDKVKQLDGSDVLRLSKEVAFLVLQREWQKVWFKHRF